MLGVEKMLPLNGDAADEGVEARGRACLFCAGPADFDRTGVEARSVAGWASL